MPKVFKNILLAASTAVLVLAANVFVVGVAHAASTAADYCKSVKSNNTKDERTACEHGYDWAAGKKDYTKLCNDNFGSKAKTCIAGGAGYSTHAANNAAAANCDIKKDSGCDLITKYVNPLVNLLSIAFGFIAVISIILGGIQYSTSGGNPQQASKAKQRITQTVIAILAYLFLYAFLQFIVPGGAFNRT
jgi:hypothetical protein